MNIDDFIHMYWCEFSSRDTGGSGINGGNDGIYDISYSPVSLECKSTDDCLIMGKHDMLGNPMISSLR